MTGFVCQSYLKERRRTPTGGLSEAGGVIGGGEGFLCPRPLGWVERPWSLGYSISPYLGKTMDTARDGMTPIGVVPVGASRRGELERVD